MNDLDFLVVSNVRIHIGTALTLPSTVVTVEHAHELPVRFIVEHWDDLPRNVIFVSDDGSVPMRPQEIQYLNSSKFLLDWLNSPTKGYMSFDPRPLGPVRRISAFIRLSGFWDAVMEPIFGELAECHDFTSGRTRCSRIVVSRERIRRLPREFWTRMLRWVQENRLPNVQCEAEDIDPCATWYVGQYLECVCPLIFTAAPNPDRSLGCCLSASYGAGGNWIDVTGHVLRHLVVRDGKETILWIPRDLDFNALFRMDPCPGTEKTLLVFVMNEKEEEPKTIFRCHERDRQRSGWYMLTLLTTE